MAITPITEYAGDVPIIGQSQPTFNQNVSDKLNYDKQLFGAGGEFNVAVSEINQTAIQVSNDMATAQSAADVAVSSGNFKGSWSVASGSYAIGDSFNHNGFDWRLNVNVSSVESSEPSGANQDWSKLPSSQQQDENTSAIAINASNISANSQFIQDNLYITPFNNDWNGYLDPEHQQYLPAPNGYPATSGAGGTTYGFEKEICYGVFSNTEFNVVTSDSDGWTFTGGIYKEYQLTEEQVSLLDSSKFYVYLVDDSGSEFYLPVDNVLVFYGNPTPSSIKISVTPTVFSSLGISKILRLFVTYGKGKVPELSPESLAAILRSDLVNLRQRIDMLASRQANMVYQNFQLVPIEVGITLNPGASTLVSLIVNGEVAAEVEDDANGEAEVLNFSATINPGETYLVQALSGSPQIKYWSELRIA